METDVDGSQALGQALGVLLKEGGIVQVGVRGMYQCHDKGTQKRQLI